MHMPIRSSERSERGVGARREAKRRPSVYRSVAFSLVAFFSAPTSHAAEAWPKLVEKGFGQEFRNAILGETKVFEKAEFWVEPDEGDAGACKQTFEETGGKITVEFVRRGRCSVKFTKGLTGYEVNYTVERDPKEFVVPAKLTVKVGAPAHVPCIFAVVPRKSETVKLLPDIEEDGFTWFEGKKPGAETVRCIGRKDHRASVAVTVVP
jgi:hypothetical protein